MKAVPPSRNAILFEFTSTSKRGDLNAWLKVHDLLSESELRDGNQNPFVVSFRSNDAMRVAMEALKRDIETSCDLVRELLSAIIPREVGSYQTMILRGPQYQKRIEHIRKSPARVAKLNDVPDHRIDEYNKLLMTAE